MAVARSVLAVHTPYSGVRHVQRCAGLHGAFPRGPVWPGTQVDWALDVFECVRRGAVTETED